MASFKCHLWMLHLDLQTVGRKPLTSLFFPFYPLRYCRQECYFLRVLIYNQVNEQKYRQDIFFIKTCRITLKYCLKMLKKSLNFKKYDIRNKLKQKITLADQTRLILLDNENKRIQSSCKIQSLLNKLFIKRGSLK